MQKHVKILKDKDHSQKYQNLLKAIWNAAVNQEEFLTLLCDRIYDEV